jgi:hypothetical protein
LKFSICRKPTQTDNIIPNSSCHPYEHKVSAIRYLFNQLHTYPITRESKHDKNILQETGYSANLITKPISHKQNIQENPHSHISKWAIFIYWGREARQITKLLKNTQFRIQFRTK